MKGSLLLCFLLRIVCGYTQPRSSIPAAGRSPWQQVPVLCYHQVRDRTSDDSRTARAYIIPVRTFRQHIQALRDSGYHAILPDQLVAYATAGAPLPSHPVLLTFDDGTASQFTNAVPVLRAAGYKAAFFIMTVSLNKPRYMTDQMLQDLAGSGHTIGCHTWDHRNVSQYSGDDWQTQVARPMRQLERITGKPVRYFAYPFGAWNTAAIQSLQGYGFVSAFQLWGPYDRAAAAFTVRRILVDGDWSGGRLLAEIASRYY